MIPVCAGCGGPPLQRLTLTYRYPRDEFEPEAVDPWCVHGSAPMRSCGSPACGAAALLATIDEIITDHAFYLGVLLEREDVHIVHIGAPGECPIYVLDDDGEDES